MKRLLLALAAVAAVVVAVSAFYGSRGGDAPEVTTAPVTRGDVVDAIGASGTLQAVTTVQVGTQVSGTIARLGADFNSIVHRGQVIAELEPSLLQSQVAQARANLVRAEADQERNRVALADAQQKLDRAEQLDAQQLVARSDLDTARVTRDSAQAALQSSAASVSQAEAALNQAQVNLEHAIITSPIDGIVIQRSVDVGQTVAASMQSPTLFVIAADLTKMQVSATIDEADIGRVADGQHVSFTVDAYPGETFDGVVSQVRLQPVVVQNVTTYEAIVDVPNADLQLKPGMTANLRIEVAARRGVLRVPASAVRFRPTAETLAAFGLTKPDGPADGRVWEYQDGVLRPVTVGLGLSDGVNVEVTNGPIDEGTPLVTRVQQASESSATATRPGATANPLMMGGGRRGGG